MNPPVDAECRVEGIWKGPSEGGREDTRLLTAPVRDISEAAAIRCLLPFCLE